MTRITPALLSLVGATFFLVGCSDAEKAVACSQNSDCDVGQVCKNDECASAECLSSTECKVGEHCSASFECTTGCEDDTDCVAGESCSDGTCAAYGCRNTHLDCDYGEFCDTTTGLCYPDDSGSCEPCDPGSDANCYASTERGTCDSTGGCPANQECYVAEWTEECRRASDCEDGWECARLTDASGATIGPVCYRTACFEGRGLVECDHTVENECARGFQCQDFGSGDGVCFGDCEWLLDNGYLGN